MNSAYAYGERDAPDDATDAQRQSAGAQLLVQTISQLTGLQIDHYAEVDLLGFFQLSSIVGGVEVNLCQAVDDSYYSGAVFPAGVQTISGADALKFVRQRHGLPRGDFDRIIRQQVYIAGVLRNILSENVLFDLGKQRELADAAGGALTVDQGLNLFDLAAQMQSITAGNIDFQTIRTSATPRTRRAATSCSCRTRTPARLLRRPLRRAAGPGPLHRRGAGHRGPADVTVDVYNGSGTSGLAATTAEQLTAAASRWGSTGNADSNSYTLTEIRYAEGDAALANTLAAAIPGRQHGAERRRDLRHRPAGHRLGLPGRRPGGHRPRVHHRHGRGGPPDRRRHELHQLMNHLPPRPSAPGAP